MRLAVWNIRPCAYLFGSDVADGVDVLYREPDECKALLDSGEVDVALIAINDVLRHVDQYAVLPQAVIASAATFPYATLKFKEGIEQVQSVEVLESHRQAGDVAEIVLREEYDLEATVRFRNTLSTNGSSPDAYLAFGNPDETHGANDRWLDVGQEWFELTALPLTWGVFAVRAGQPSEHVGGQLENLVSKALAPDRSQAWLDAHPQLTERERSALEFDVRFQFDVEVLAGLDELAHYLFYFGKVDEIPTPRFSKPPESIRPSE